MNTYFSLLITFLLTSSVVSAQQIVTIGGPGSASGQFTASPVSNYYESMHYQVIYTASELTAAGFLTGTNINSLAWDVTQVPNNSLPNYTIRIGHTSNATSTMSNHILASTLTAYYTNANYTPAVGFDVLTLQTPFVWNGVDNIVFDVCWSASSGWSSSGQLNTYNFTDGAHYYRADGSDMCGSTTSFSNGDQNTKPVVQFDIVLPVDHDAGVTNLVAPIIVGGCNALSSTETVTVEITNFGLLGLTDAALTLFVNNVPVLTETFSGTIAPGNTTNFTFSQTADLSALGAMEIKVAAAKTPLDEDSSNDTLTTLNFNAAISAQAVDGARCGFGTVDLGVTGLANQFFWFGDSLTTELLDTGTALTTPYLYGDTTYWVEGRAPYTYFFSLDDKDIEDGSFYDHYPDGLVFDAKYDITIDAVTVYPLGPGDITINIEDASGMVTHTTTYTHLTTATEVSIPLGFDVPAGTGYEMNATGTNIELFRNKDSDNNIVVSYPYILNDAVFITGPINDLFDAYYFFYNWEVTYLGCASERIPVHAVVNPSGLMPAFNVTDESLPGNGAVATTVTGGTAPYNFNWDNGLATADLAGLNAGTYMVTISDANDCTDTFSVVIENIINTNEIASISNLSIFPNPSNGQFNISIELDGIHEVAIDVINMLGQTVYSTTPESIAARQYPINVSDKPAGIYQVRVRVDNETTTQTIIIK